jgi:excisionase family DNA binding protein
MDEMEFMSPRDVRAWLKISRSKAAQICGNEVPSYRIGTLVRVRREDLEEFLTKNRSQPVRQANRED